MDNSVKENGSREAAPPKEDERRISKRHDCDGFAEVVVPYSGFLFRGEIANVSEFGCYIKTRARLTFRRSTPVELRFTISGEQFSLQARTAVVKFGLGAGFEFTEIEPTVHKNLLQLIEELEERASYPKPPEPVRNSGY